jgi:hypothetical protein
MSSATSFPAVPKTAGPMVFPQFLPGAKTVLVSNSPSTTLTLNAADIDAVLLAAGPCFT